MDISQFAKFCEDFCNAAGARIPELAGGADGATGFEMELDDTRVTVVGVSAEGVDEARVLVEFGAPQRDDDASIWQGLLDANYVYAGTFSLCFCRDPLSGKVMLQMKAPLATTTGAEIFGECRRLAALAADWRRGEFRIGVPDSALRTETVSEALA
jgi:hypothetical protein